jgi:hypothetical protein
VLRNSRNLHTVYVDIFWINRVDAAARRLDGNFRKPPAQWFDLPPMLAPS